MSISATEAKLFRLYPEPCCITDRKGLIRCVNEAWVTELGWSREESVGRGFITLIHPDDRARVEQNLEESRHSPDGLEYRHRIRTASSNYRSIRWKFVGDDNVCIFAYDAGDAGLMDARDRFESLASTVPGVIYQWFERKNGQRGFYYVSPKIRDYYDLTPEELVEDWTRIRLHPDDMAAWQASVEEAVATTSDWNFEGRFLTADGAVKWWRGISTPFRITDNEIVFNGIIVDVTAEMESESALRAATERFELAVKGTNDGIWDWDLTKDTMWFSPRWKAILGYEDHELPNEHETWRNAILREDQADAWRLANAFNTGEVDEYLATHRYLHKDGTIRHLLSRATHILDRNGNVTRMVGAVTDVTELIHAREEAVLANKAKTLFLANMSHEIRTPMNGVLGMTQLLSKSELTADQQDYVNAITASGESLLVILNDILDLSKIEAGKLVLDPNPCCIEDLLKEMGRIFRPMALAKGLDFAVYLPILKMPTVLVDSSRLQQVITNLVGNALKFTHTGMISISASYGEGVLAIEVKDTGVGISDDRQKAVFDSFIQADASTSRQYGGTGLGLTISRNLVLLMGGELELSSELGVGSTFQFSFPAQACETPASGGEALAPVLPEEKLTGKILLAEDNEVNVLVAQRLLEQMGFTVVVAADGVEAVNLAVNDTFDLILMDLHMPNMDGADATRAIRQLQGAGVRTPIVAMTAAALSEDRDKCFESGMDGYISKPFRADDVRALLIMHLSKV